MYISWVSYWKPIKICWNLLLETFTKIANFTYSLREFWNVILNQLFSNAILKEKITYNKWRESAYLCALGQESNPWPFSASAHSLTLYLLTTERHSWVCTVLAFYLLIYFFLIWFAKGLLFYHSLQIINFKNLF